MSANNVLQLIMANTTVVIDANGQLRELGPGEQAQPGEVVVTIDNENPSNVDIQANLINEDASNQSLDLENEIAQIIGQIEQGEDPTQNDDFATAAGGQNGSSPTGTGDIERTGAEVIASTQFDTSGLEGQGLSETQSLELAELIAEALIAEALVTDSDSVAEDETDEPLVITGTLESSEAPAFVEQTNTEGSFGSFSIDEDGNWTYEADSAFNELNVGDALVDEFDVETLDGGAESVTVTINGTNDLPQFEPNDGDQYSFSYNEGISDTDVIGQVNATDPDNQVLAYSITGNVFDESNNALYRIDSVTGEITLTLEGAEAYTNDFETLANQHTVVVTVTEVDGNGTPQSVDIDVVLNEQDVNEPPVFEPPIEGDEYTFGYDENSAQGETLGQVSASDPEEAEVSYRIDSNVQIEGVDLFQIDDNGNISLTAAGAEAFTNDYEALTNSHNITVIASDGVNETEIAVTLNEQDVNEPPEFEPPEEGDDYSFSYYENSKDSTIIGQVSATDPDAGDSVSYSIRYGEEDALDGLFEIDSNGNISLTPAGVEAFTNDFEDKFNLNAHSVTVVATDSEGAKSTIEVSLNELDVNEPPEFEPPEEGDDYSFSYYENSKDGTIIGQVSATDPDAGDSVSYSIRYGEEDALDGLFEIDSNGNISLTPAGVEAFTNDFEDELNLNAHSITVVATDTEGAESTIEVSLNELDVNEPPEFEPPEEGDDYSFSYYENSLDSTNIGQVTANDPDAGDSVSYSIRYEENDPLDGLFEIDSEGNISLTAVGVQAFTNDYEDELGLNAHTITVVATDSEGAESTIEVSLNELDEEERPCTDDVLMGDIGGTVTTVIPAVNYNIAILADVSGSMGNDFENNKSRIDVMKSSLKNFVEQVDTHSGTINISLISFASRASLVIALEDIQDNNWSALETAIEELDDGGATNYEAAFLKAGEWFDDMDNDFENVTLFLSDGKPTTHNGDESRTGGSTDPLDVSRALEAYEDVAEISTVRAIGIATNESNTELLRKFDNSDVVGTDSDGDPIGQVDVVTRGDQLDAALIGETSNTVLRDLDDDHLNGACGHDTIFGDAINVSNLPWGVDGNPVMPEGFVGNEGLDGLKEFLRLKNESEPSQAQIDAFIAENHMLYDLYDETRGGNDTLYGGSGDDTLYGQGGDDVIFGDSLSTAHLPWGIDGNPAKPDDFDDQSGFDGLARFLELKNGSEPSEAEVYEFIWDNLEEYQLANLPNGGDDTLVGGTGDDTLVGGSGADVFQWLDSTLDDGTDVIKDFELAIDMIDLDDVLDDTESENVTELIENIDVEIVDDDLALTIEHEEGEQTIVVEGGATILGDFIAPGNDFDSIELLSQIIKNDAA
ncbi:cadherin domain-containing protein [Vibrio paucivorans]